MKTLKSFIAMSALTAAGAANATVWNLTMHADQAFAALQGNLVMDFTGIYDDVSNSGLWTGNTHSVNSPLDISANYSQNFTMNETTGMGFWGQLSDCTDNSGGAICTGFAPVLVGNYFNNVIGNTDAAHKSHVSFTPTDGGVYQWTFQFNTTRLDASGNTILVYLPVPTTVTLTQAPLPAATWLFGSGLMGLVGAARRRRSV